MKKAEIINQIVERETKYFGLPTEMIPNDFFKWIKNLLTKLDNKALAVEARKHGIEIKAVEII